MNNDPVTLGLALAAGIVLGLMFFVGLWWTIRRGVASERSAPWFLGSLVLRTSVALAGFYVVGRDHWERLLICLLGFLVARLVVTQVIRAGQMPPDVAQEAGHAPQSR